MARRQYTGNGQEDAPALTKAYNDALVDAVGNVSLKDLLEAFDGSKSDLARELAGISSSSPLSKLSKSEQSKYATQFKNIDRWSRYERGERGKQARNIERSKATQEKARMLYTKREPPPGNVTATITGWIGYAGDWRYRTISIPDTRHTVDTDKFNAAMQAGDTREAFQALFDAYAPALTVAQADSFELRYE